MLPIETERWLIRRFSIQDAEDILSFSADPNIAPYLQGFPGSTIEEVQEYICQQNSYKLGELDHCFDLAVVLKDEDRVIGLLTLISRENKQGELGFASPYQANYSLAHVRMRALRSNRHQQRAFFTHVSSSGVRASLTRAIDVKQEAIPKEWTASWKMLFTPLLRQKTILWDFLAVLTAKKSHKDKNPRPSLGRGYRGGVTK